MITLPDDILANETCIEHRVPDWHLLPWVRCGTVIDHGSALNKVTPHNPYWVTLAITTVKVGSARVHRVVYLNAGGWSAYRDGIDKPCGDNCQSPESFRPGSADATSPKSWGRKEGGNLGLVQHRICQLLEAAKKRGDAYHTKRGWPIRTSSYERAGQTYPLPEIFYSR
jgi:hypothetical protein